MKLEEEIGRGLVVELRIGNHRLHLELIDELDARDGDAHLNRFDDRVAGALEIRECADAARYRLRDAIKLEGELDDDAKRALGTDQQPRQVISGGRLLHTFRRGDE